MVKLKHYKKCSTGEKSSCYIRDFSQSYASSLSLLDAEDEALKEREQLVMSDQIVLENDTIGHAFRLNQLRKCVEICREYSDRDIWLAASAAYKSSKSNG